MVLLTLVTDRDAIKVSRPCVASELRIGASVCTSDRDHFNQSEVFFIESVDLRFIDAADLHAGVFSVAGRAILFA